jgi:hypothetical protein
MLPNDEYSVTYYDILNRTEAPQALKLADLVVEMYAPRTVTDLGCATGLYMACLMNKGVLCRGVELSPNALDPDVCIVDPSAIIKTDLREPILFPDYSDVVLCLEVLEHIQEEYVDRAIRNVVSAGNHLIISPSPHGGGEHHHNPKPKDYWMERFAKHGYKEVPEKSKIIQDGLATVPHATWIDNIYVLEIEDAQNK